MTRAVLRFLTACAEGCYKHYDQASGKWICCKCNC
jgi:hypothetical protein